MSLKKEEIEHIASLARIGISKEEIGKYGKELSAVLEYFKKLEELDTEKLEPIGHITGAENHFREDRESDFGDIGRKDIMKNVPEEKNGQIKVKSVL